jgi:DNA-binding transcriptional MerR regulator
MNEPPLTLGAVARRYGCPTWQIRRLYERGLLPPAKRVGAYRVVAVSDLPLVERALRDAGYLPHDGDEADVHCHRISRERGDK